MDKKSDLLACLARLQFDGADGSYSRTLQPGLSIHVGVDDNGYSILPWIDVLKLLPKGKTIDDFIDGPADKFSWKMHATSNDFNLDRFVKNVGKVRTYLKRVAEFYA